MTTTSPSRTDADAAPGGAPSSSAGSTTCMVEGVISYLGLAERARAMAVCRAWLKAAERPEWWVELDARKVFRAYAKGTTIGGRISPSSESLNAKVRALIESDRFARLERINLECCKHVGDSEVELLAATRANTLKSINLNAVHNVTSQAVGKLLGASCKLESVSLYWHPKLSDGALMALAASRSARTLTLLNVSGCQSLTDRGIEAVASSCHRLERLDVTRCPRLTDATLGALADSPCGARLVELVMYADANFTDVGVARLANARPARLEVLDVCGARLLTSASIAALARPAGDALRVLNFSWCVALDDAVGVALAAHCTTLHSLSFHGIRTITDISVDALATSRVADTLRVFDVNGCVGITDYRRHTDRLHRLFPHVAVWTVHR